MIKFDVVTIFPRMVLAGLAEGVVSRGIVRGLIDTICRTCDRMKLWGEVGEEARYLVEVTALSTPLAMNFLTRGRFET